MSKTLKSIDKKFNNEWRINISSMDELNVIDAIENIPESISSREVRRRLLNFLSDGRELVRTTAAEYLAFYGNREVLLSLRRSITTEKSTLVKGYMLEALGFVGKAEDVKTLISVISGSRSSFLKINALSGLFILSRRLMVRNLLHYLKKGTSLNKARAAETIGFACNRYTWIELAKQLESIQLQEKDSALKERIEWAVRVIKRPG